MTDTEKTFDKYLSKLGTTITYGDDCFVLSRNGVDTSFDYSYGLGQLMTSNSEQMKPVAASVFSSLLIDRESMGCYFDEWCEDYGFNSDSISDKKIYDASLKNAEQLYSVFSVEEIRVIRELLEDY